MHVDSMRPDDAPDLIRLAHVHGLPVWTIPPGATGHVVRDGAQVIAFCFLRETAQGHFYIDEMWQEKTPRGRRALHILADFVERTMLNLARRMSRPVFLAGATRATNPSFARALERRGYQVVGSVRGKEFVA